MYISVLVQQRKTEMFSFITLVEIYPNESSLWMIKGVSSFLFPAGTISLWKVYVSSPDKTLEEWTQGLKQSLFRLLVPLYCTFTVGCTCIFLS